MKHTIKLTIIMDDQPSQGWPLYVQGETDMHDKPFPASMNGLTLEGAMRAGESVTNLILSEAKRKGIVIDTV